MDNTINLADWATNHLETLFFYLTAFITVPFAFGVLFDNKIIRAGFLLIGVFGGISGLFLLLHAQFLAMAQLMIYAVGITLVVVIALMLTNTQSADGQSPSIAKSRLPAAATATLLFLTLYFAIRSEPWKIVDTAPACDYLTELGIGLMTNYALPFEFASVLLLVALIGAIILAKSDHFVNSKKDVVDKNITDTKETKNNVVKV